MLTPWHRDEYERVHMLAGMADQPESDCAIPLHPGDTATCEAGEPAGDCPVNTRAAEARDLAIGNRTWTGPAGDPAASPCR